MPSGSSQGDDFSNFVAAIVAGNGDAALKLLDALPQLTKMRAAQGATRQAPERGYFDQIRHHMYAGDTALHIAAAAFQARIAEELMARGADVRASNRRGAQPLHYAVDGGPGLPVWDPVAQAEIITMLIAAGADPNAVDKSGVAPLHRAVRNRCAAAVGALIEGGADPNAPNKSGSTPLLLATRSTGRGGSGSAGAKAQQQEILRLLEKHGGGAQHERYL